MGGRDAGETGVAAAGAVEVRQVGARMHEEGAADQVADAAGLEGAARLEVFELEEDAAGRGRGLALSRTRPRRVRGGVPSCGFGESSGLDQGGRYPGLGELRGWQTAHD